MGGRSGIARGLSSPELSVFADFDSSGVSDVVGAAAFASPPVAARNGGAMVAPRLGGSAVFASLAGLVLVSPDSGASVFFGGFATSSADESPPK
jgi:hypothetical protein